MFHMWGTSVTSVLCWAQVSSAGGRPSSVWGGGDETTFSSERNPDTGCQSTVIWWPVSYRAGYSSLLSARTELVFRALGRGASSLNSKK